MSAGSPSPPLRTVVVGAGPMGARHADAIRRVGSVVAAVVDRDPVAARGLARRHGARDAFRLGEVVTAEGIEVAHLCVPLVHHAAVAAEALGLGLHVLGEKPLAPTARETAALYALAAEHEVLFCPVHQFAFQPGIRRAVRTFGRIGELRNVDATFCSAGGVGRDDAALDAIVGDVLPHPLSLVDRLVPGALVGADWLVARPRPGELRAVTTGDPSLAITVSMGSRPTVATLTLHGTTGTIRADLFHGFSVVEPGGVSRARKAAHPFDLALRTGAAAGVNLARRARRSETAYPGLRTLVRAFHAAAATGGPAPVSEASALTVASARDALLAR